MRRQARDRGVEVAIVRQKGSHMRVKVGDCETTAQTHKGRDIPRGTLRAIQNQTEHCLGRGWLL